jgi:hypothetical protein
LCFSADSIGIATLFESYAMAVLTDIITVFIYKLNLKLKQNNHIINMEGMDQFDWRIKMHCQMCGEDKNLARDDMKIHFDECLKLHSHMENIHNIMNRQLAYLWTEKFNRHAQYENSKNKQ